MADIRRSPEGRAEGPRAAERKAADSCAVRGPAQDAQYQMYQADCFRLGSLFFVADLRARMILAM
ncbi:hypothetical protein GCM10010245_31310 [Streptomyces spectabilis]|nr:hypothetical protein GCM10010245_31310 [Streptomyces spectabilis]